MHLQSSNTPYCTFPWVLRLRLLLLRRGSRLSRLRLRPCFANSWNSAETMHFKCTGPLYTILNQKHHATIVFLLFLELPIGAPLFHIVSKCFQFSAWGAHHVCLCGLLQWIVHQLHTDIWQDMAGHINGANSLSVEYFDVIQSHLLWAIWAKRIYIKCVMHYYFLRADKISSSLSDALLQLCKFTLIRDSLEGRYSHTTQGKDLESR